MAIHSEEPEVADEVPVVKPKLTIVVILAMLLGVLLTVGAAGAFYHLQQSKALLAEVLVVTDALKEKSLQLDEMRGQIEVLSKQMHLLKEYSVARSSKTSGKEMKAESAASAADVAVSAPMMSDASENTGLPHVQTAPKAKKPKPATQNCELVGKSPEEQAATLKRCVDLIEAPKGMPRKR